MMQYTRRPWWKEKSSEDASNQVESWIINFDTYQNGRIYDLFRYMSLYANRDMLSMSRSTSDPYLPTMPQQIVNRTKANIDTLVGRHIEDETKAVFNVSDGDFEDKDKAEKLERFVFGEMYRVHGYEMCRMALRDAAMVGDGWIYGGIRGKKPYYERVMPLEMILDELACLSGQSSELYRRQFLPRQVVMDMYPDKADEIEALPEMNAPYLWPGSDTDMVRLNHAWHLPNAKGQGGRYVLGCGHVVIADEEWKRPTFPFARIQWCSTPIGGYAMGLVEEVSPIQMELDLVTRRLQHSIRLFATPRIWQQAGTKISAQYNNMVGNVYKYAGMKPEIDSGGNGVPAVLFEREQQLIALLDAQAGVSAMELTGDVPSHTDSRPALREVQEIAAGRRDWISKKWQEFCSREMAELIINTSRDVVEKFGSYKAHGKAEKFIETIDFKDIDLEDDRYCINIQPGNLLGTTIAGKRMVAGDLMEKKLITDPEDMWEMLSGMPDVDRMRRLKTASKTLAEKQISSIISKRKLLEPVETQDIALARKLAQDELNLLYTMQNVPDEVFDMMRAYIMICDQIEQAANPPPDPGTGMPPPAPQQLPGAAALGAPAPGPVPQMAPPPAPVPTMQ